MELYTNARFISCEKENRIYTAMVVKGGHIVGSAMKTASLRATARQNGSISAARR